ncbi:TRAP transporter small permease [Photobacterium sp. 1_MG-2023]|uniref:TRAP transporter small permease n=1 Tax=Photobacterium sp. 1_MG-2023 TaxID=3062646 RepID=UPI0026E2B5F8|nr:TRAP transporter small permease [Photobacterium sp. 1_MG-2023]MDO6708337.1 TRAP transporter small permease [Photobacterium sp. 1_MG-2023]
MNPTFSVLKRLRQLLGVIASLTLFSMLVLTVIDVVGRYFFHRPFPGGVELIEMMLAIVVFSAFSLITWSEEHICVDLLDDWFPVSLTNLRQAFINLCSAFALGLIAWKIWGLGVRSLSYGETTDVLEIPIGYVICFISFIGWISMVIALALAYQYLFSDAPVRNTTQENDS